MSDADHKLLDFFFQAEDGIRDLTVTGVQTCALPISLAASSSVMAIRRAALGAGAVRRLAGGRLITPGPEEPEVLRTEEPIQRGRPARHGAGELEQTGGALAQLEERTGGGREQGTYQLPEGRLVAHERHRAAGVPVREPAHDAD